MDVIKCGVTPERIVALKDNEIFVFGSNVYGQHGGGAARFAFRNFGARMGVGVGMTGRCYAIPAMHGGIDVIRLYVRDFLEYARSRPDLVFLVTKIGCGIAGYTEAQIAPLFLDALQLSNVTLPHEFIDILVMTSSDDVLSAPKIEEVLTGKGVKPTANRILIYRALSKSDHPLSLADLVGILSPMDKASIFRSLTVLGQCGVVHVFEDGSGSTKYELCHSNRHEHSLGDEHVHFHCEICGETICLDNIPVPMVQLPDGAVAHTVNYVVKGICPKCNSR